MLTFNRAGRLLGLAVVLAAGSIPGSAEANQIARAESLTCDNLECVDALEFKCTQSSSMICFTIDTAGSPETLSFVSTAVGVTPASLYGNAVALLQADGSSEFFCLARPQKEGTMKTLLTVGVTGIVPPNAHYTARGECFSGDVINGLTTRKTTLAVKQDE